MEVTKQEMQKGLEEIKQEIQKGQQGMEKVVEEKIGKKVEEEIEKISEQVEERIERFTGNFTLISQRMEVLEKKLLAGGNENKNKSMSVPAFPEPVLSSPAPPNILQGLRTSANENKTLEKTGERLQEHASEVERLANLAFSTTQQLCEK
ncbi:hypothetical protein TNCV_776111 [Trichonephila clavipes]|nr:hypothetical protein TNCV_776111 [Trichonephila clavipes]